MNLDERKAVFAVLIEMDRLGWQRDALQELHRSLIPVLPDPSAHQMQRAQLYCLSRVLMRNITSWEQAMDMYRVSAPEDDAYQAA